MRLDGSTAFAAALRNRFRKYPDRRDGRFADPLVLPSVRPSFRIGRDSAVFTIGSCFAREVEDALVTAGFAVPTAAFRAPAGEAPGRSNRVLNQYNPGTMLQCLQAAGRKADDAALFPAADGQVIDCLLATGGRPVARERALERRQQINDLYRDGLAAAGTVVIMLGLIEAWHDNETGLYLNEAPPRGQIESRPGRFEFRRLGVEDSLVLVAAIVERLRSDRARNILMTVSPVPLQVTFSGDDAVTANAYSKSVLRVVAEAARSELHHVDYFPSFEIVTAAGPHAFGEDNVHVRPAVVQKIVAHMMANYA